MPAGSDPLACHFSRSSVACSLYSSREYRRPSGVDPMLPTIASCTRIALCGRSPSPSHGDVARDGRQALRVVRTRERLVCLPEVEVACESSELGLQVGLLVL